MRHESKLERRDRLREKRDRLDDRIRDIAAKALTLVRGVDLSYSISPCIALIVHMHFPTARS